jgi:O-antigen/teichoic acid export membrane protein
VRSARFIRSWAAGSRPTWFREWAADSGVLLLSQFAAMVATSVLAILIARSLSPHDWGIFSGFLALSLALAVFAEFGLSAWVLRELSDLAATDDVDSDETKRRASRLVGGGFLFTSSLGAVFVVGAAVCTAALALDARLSVAVVSLVAYSAVRSGSTSLEAFFRSRRKLRRVVAALLTEKAVLLLLVTLLVLAGAGLVGIAIAYPIAGFARLLVNGANIVVRGELVFSQTRLADARHVVGGSLAFAVNRASLNVVPRLDTFLLVVLSPTAAGYFALGNRILGPALILPVVMSTTLYPFLARESRDSTAGWTVVVLLTAGGVVLAGIGVVAAPLLVPLLFGVEYLDAVPVVQVMLVAIPLVFATNPLLANVYTSRREGRGLTLALAATSFAGTGMIVAGQLLTGPLAAAGGFVVRHVLFMGTLVAAGLLRAPSGPDSHVGSASIPPLSHAAKRSVP